MVFNDIIKLFVYKLFGFLPEKKAFSLYHVWFRKIVYKKKRYTVKKNYIYKEKDIIKINKNLYILT